MVTIAGAVKEARTIYVAVVGRPIPRIRLAMAVITGDGNSHHVARAGDASCKNLLHTVADTRSNGLTGQYRPDRFLNQDHNGKHNNRSEGCEFGRVPQHEEFIDEHGQRNEVVETPR
jgi:hypothetical protein